MASKPTDDTCNPRNPGPNHTKSSSRGKPPPGPCDSAQATEAPIAPEPPASDLHDQVADEELLQMLEQLSDTIDTAQNVLSEQHLLAEESAQAAAQPPEAATPPDPEQGNSRAARIAAAAAVCIGIAVPGGYWLNRTQPTVSPGIVQAISEPPPPETIIARRPITETPAAVKPEPVEKVSTAPAPEKIQAAAVALPESTSPDPATPGPLDAEPPSRTSATPDTPKPPRTATASLAKQPPPRKRAPLEGGEEARLLDNGRGLVSSGDVASARLVYEYAAGRGSVDAMFALAQTYDPAVLDTWNVIGIRPDMKIALEWYARAARLGHDAADARADELEKQHDR